MDNTFIPLFRSILEWEWYTDNNTKSLFIHCLLKANYTDKEWRGITIKRGSFLTSLDKLSKETGLSVQNVRTSLKKLELTNELTNKSTNKNRIITMKNYDKYNQSTNKLTSKQQTTNKQLTTTNKDNKEIKDIYNKIDGLSNIQKLSPDRTKHLNARINEYSYDTVIEVLDIVSKSSFLKGNNNKNWKCNFDWIMNPNNFVKILEGNYTKEEKKEESTNPYDGIDFG